MTRALALDTSSSWGSLALVEQSTPGADPEVVAELGIRVPRSHSPRLLQRVELLLAEARWDKTGLDLFVAVRGPGSFTGVRIGLGTVRGLSVATGRPCVGVTSLLALAEALGPVETRRIPLISAGRGEIYGARYDADSSPPVAQQPPWVGPPEHLLERVGSDSAVLFGSGVAEIRSELRDRLEHVRFAVAARHLAGAAGRLALLRGSTTDGTADPLSPLYVRPPDALLKPRNR